MLFDFSILFSFLPLQSSENVSLLLLCFFDVFNVGNWFRHEWWKISVWIFDEFRNRDERIKLLRSAEFYLRVHCLSLQTSQKIKFDRLAIGKIAVNFDVFASVCHLAVGFVEWAKFISCNTFLLILWVRDL